MPLIFAVARAEANIKNRSTLPSPPLHLRCKGGSKALPLAQPRGGLGGVPSIFAVARAETRIRNRSAPPQPSPAPAVQGREQCPSFGAARGGLGGVPLIFAVARAETRIKNRSTPPQPSPAPAVQGREQSPPFGAAKGRVGRGAVDLHCDPSRNQPQEPKHHSPALPCTCGAREGAPSRCQTQKRPGNARPPFVPGGRQWRPLAGIRQLLPDNDARLRSSRPR